MVCLMLGLLVRVGHEVYVTEDEVEAREAKRAQRKANKKRKATAAAAAELPA